MFIVYNDNSRISKESISYWTLTPVQTQSNEWHCATVKSSSEVQEKEKDVNRREKKRKDTWSIAGVARRVQN